jgi:hypothetical protein
MRYGIAAILAPLLCLLGLSCSKVDRIKQVRTFADMQTITSKIEVLREQKPEAIGEPTRVRSLILGTSHGRDAWQHEFLFYTEKARKGRLSYVLVSMGSDGRPDFADPREYFNLHESVIHDEPWRDIVFRDGQPLTRGGK